VAQFPVAGFRGGPAAATERRSCQRGRARGWHWCMGFCPPPVITVRLVLPVAPGQERRALLSGR
jgi:hypothetical protein